ncbi:DUF86 domain-containing protein [Brevibacterium otitidis]|uniref:DUF86 domain-containing protein n=1 Tax=Brevibacterium otitidis TaxID=53364 RepID=A0ABV5WZE3_9MICO
MIPEAGLPRPRSGRSSSAISRTTPEILADALTHLQKTTEYLQHGEDQLVVDAICMRLSAGIEALSGWPKEERDRLFSGMWPDMRGMRNRIAHGYLDVDPQVVQISRAPPHIYDLFRSTVAGHHQPPAL